MLDNQILDISHELKQLERSQISQMKATIPITRTKIEDFLLTMGKKSNNQQQSLSQQKKSKQIILSQDLNLNKGTIGKSKELFLDFQTLIIEEFKLIYQKKHQSQSDRQLTLEAIKIIMKVFLDALSDLSETLDEQENERKLQLFKKEHQLDFKNYLQQKSSESLQLSQSNSLAFYTGLEKLNEIQELLNQYMEQYFKNLQQESLHQQNYKKFEESSVSIFKIIETIIDDLFTMFLIYDQKSLEVTLNGYNILGKDFDARVECKSNWWYKQERFGIGDKNAIKLSFPKVLEPEELKPTKDKLYHITIEKSYPEIFPIKLEKIYNLNLIKNTTQSSYQSTSLLNTHLEKELQIPEYFHPKCRKKVLHYFEPGTKNLWTFDLEQLRLHLNKSTPPLEAYQRSLEKIEITELNFVISPNYRSLITPTGKIYLCGGIGSENDGDSHLLASKPKTNIDNSLFLYKKMSMDGDQFWTQSNMSFIGGAQTQNKSRMIAEKQQSKHILQKKANMNIARKYFGFAFLENHLYVVGGRTKSKKCTRSCERFGIETGMWKQIANLNEPVSSLTLCTFNEKYLFKFGGINIDGYPDKTIERYDPMQNNWWVVRYSCLNVDEQIELPVKALSSQINDKQILIFGGRNVNGFKADNSYLFEINDEDKTVMSKTKLFGTIESVKEQLLLSYIGEFQENSIITYKNSIYYLRNDNFS